MQAQAGFFRVNVTFILAFILFFAFKVAWADTDAFSVYKIKPGIDEYTLSGKPIQRDRPVTSLDESRSSKSTTDHSKLKELEGPFDSGPEVTKACLGCHNKAGDQFIHNKHWTWSYTNPVTGQKLGKSVLINNFCTNARGNEGMCAQCHAGYGLTDVKTYDFSNQQNIDCLVCHESTGGYYKLPPTTGNKACSVMFEGKDPINWIDAAKSVGLSSRSNCGSCHFYGGGGDNVKHGDLSSALIHATREVDVHMGEDGENFSCVICHVGQGHEWAGSRYNMMAKDENGTGKPGSARTTATCESCHGNQPHALTLTGIKLNGHTDRVACESCHIPAYAKGGVATKMDWDWRTAGRTKNGAGYNEEGYTQGNGEHRHTYKSIKGNFKYDENVQPIYRWFNGQSIYTTIDTHFDPSKPVEINSVEGAANDPESRIWPFKRMHTVQPYDKGNNTLVYMHLWGNDNDSFWGNYDFGRAIKAGMAKDNVPYSGEFGFIDTYSYWPINHMVAPKEEALACGECHAKNGRMSELKGFYMPGRDANVWLDRIGISAVLATLLGVLAHGAIRIVLSVRRNR